MLDVKNRNDLKPSFPFKENQRQWPSSILKARGILRKGLQQFLEVRKDDLETYLTHIIESDIQYFLKTNTIKRFVSTTKCFNSFWTQFNEKVCENYAIKEYDIDKLDQCNVAKFLTTQTAVKYFMKL